MLITGASSGIGRELARPYAQDGAGVVLIAHSQDRLRELAAELARKYGVHAQVLPADLSEPGSPRQIPGVLAQRGIDVDILVNNANFGAHGSVAGLGAQRQLDIIDVNVPAFTQLTALLLPGMLARRIGAILNVASNGRCPARPEPGRLLRHAAGDAPWGWVSFGAVPPGPGKPASLTRCSLWRAIADLGRARAGPGTVTGATWPPGARS